MQRRRIDFRNEHYNSKIRIVCPKHGNQATYDLYGRGKKNKDLGIGCRICFKSKPVKIFDRSQKI